MAIVALFLLIPKTISTPFSWWHRPKNCLLGGFFVNESVVHMERIVSSLMYKYSRFSTRPPLMDNREQKYRDGASGSISWRRRCYCSRPWIHCTLTGLLKCSVHAVFIKQQCHVEEGVKQHNCYAPFSLLYLCYVLRIPKTILSPFLEEWGPIKLLVRNVYEWAL